MFVLVLRTSGAAQVSASWHAHPAHFTHSTISVVSVPSLIPNPSCRRIDIAACHHDEGGANGVRSQVGCLLGFCWDWCQLAMSTCCCDNTLPKQAGLPADGSREQQASESHVSNSDTIDDIAVAAIGLRARCRSGWSGCSPVCV